MSITEHGHRSRHRRASVPMRVAALALLAGVAGCASAGDDYGPFDGTPDNPVTNFSIPLSDISEEVQVAPRYVHMQFDGAQSPTVASGPHGPGDLKLDIDPDSANIIVFRNSEVAAVFDIDFDDDTKSFDSSFYTDGSTHYRATMLIPGAASGYDYTTYGVWSRDLTTCLFSGCGSSFFADAFYFGTPTIAADVPQNGQAVFNGTMKGYYSPNTQSAVSISGDATLNVNFGTKAVTGSFHNIATGAILGPGVGPFGDINIDATVNGRSLNGTVTGGLGGSGPITGEFFGPAADEIGGAFRMTGNGDTIGSFAAQQ